MEILQAVLGEEANYGDAIKNSTHGWATEEAALSFIEEFCQRGICTEAALTRLVFAQQRAYRGLQDHSAFVLFCTVTRVRFRMFLVRFVMRENAHTH
jgi:hypothetical protein